MEVFKPIVLTSIDEIRIVHNVRLIHRHDLNPVYTKDNLRVQFEISGEVKGTITCYLCLDNKDLTASERNYLFPLFVETMNILVGRQISLNEEFQDFQIKMSSPKLNMLPKEINTNLRSSTQKYELELEDLSYQILTEYSLEAIN
jgi:hypothetical protein